MQWWVVAEEGSDEDSHLHSDGPFPSEVTVTLLTAEDEKDGRWKDGKMKAEKRRKLKWAESTSSIHRDRYSVRYVTVPYCGYVVRYISHLPIEYLY